MASMQDVIRKRMVIDPESGCWEWTGSRNRVTGYGRCADSLGSGYAHRASYEAFVGEIQPGLQIDHLCRNRGCVNPAHLEAVTPSENTRRSPIHVSRVNAAKTHCPQGHPYTAANTYLRPGSTGRDCKACRRLSVRRYQLRRSLAGAR